MEGCVCNVPGETDLVLLGPAQDEKPSHPTTAAAGASLLPPERGIHPLGSWSGVLEPVLATTGAR